MATKAKSTTRPGRPLKPLITHDAVIKSALDLIDKEGLESFSVHALARKIGVMAPSLYYHFKDKDELLAEVARALMLEIGEESPATHRTWEERMINLSVATRRVLLRHAHAAPLILRFFPRFLMLSAYEKSLRECPYPAEVHMIISETFEKMTFGTSLFAAAAIAQKAKPMPDFDESKFPKLAHAISVAPQDEEQVLIASLRLFLDGLRAQYPTHKKTED